MATSYLHGYVMRFDEISAVASAVRFNGLRVGAFFFLNNNHNIWL